MAFKLVLTIVSVLILISLLLIYFLPLSIIHFDAIPSGNTNFSLSPEDSMQFYPNMRFPDSEISYRIENCTMAKEEDMETAFEEIENLTPLLFYPAESGEQIFITCDERIKEEGGLFIAGEGGPTKIITAGKFAVILHGEILLIEQSKCPRPNVAVHELLHVLGFGHSRNKDNIMYNVTKCSQEIGDEIPMLLNSLYSIPGYPDLAISNASASMSGRFLNLDLSITNEGLSDAGESEVIIYSEGKPVRTIPIDAIEIGKGRLISIKNIWISQLKVDNIEVSVNSEFDEINKDNNKIKLEIRE